VSFVIVTQTNFHLYVDKIVSVDRSYFPHPWSEKDWKELFVQNIEYRLYILLENESLVGFSLFSIDIESRFAHLFKIQINPTFMRHGHASSLLRDSMDELTKDGVRRFYLEVGTKNYPAIKLYENNLFESLCIKKGFYSGGEDAYAMQRINE
jgi:ribosomal-protein-alanine N-acetyltransferase